MAPTPEGLMGPHLNYAGSVQGAVCPLAAPASPTAQKEKDLRLMMWSEPQDPPARVRRCWSIPQWGWYLPHPLCQGLSPQWISLEALGVDGRGMQHPLLWETLGNVLLGTGWRQQCP